MVWFQANATTSLYFTVRSVSHVIASVRSHISNTFSIFYYTLSQGDTGSSDKAEWLGWVREPARSESCKLNSIADYFSKSSLQCDISSYKLCALSIFIKAWGFGVPCYISEARLQKAWWYWEGLSCQRPVLHKGQRYILVNFLAQRYCLLSE